MKTVAFVPIKLDSQRLPHKNILPLAGHPLCWHICNTLIHVKGIDEVCVYCSNENVTKFIPESVQFIKRPKWLDGNEVKGFSIYNEFIKEDNADIYVLAHTTSPFIRPKTIEHALSHVQNGECDSAFSARKEQTFSWYMGKPINYDLTDVPRTQDMEPVWIETSAFYIFEKEVFTKHSRRIGFHPYIQETDQLESIDIDNKDDYELACIIAEKEKMYV